MSILSVVNARKSFGAVKALDGASLELRKGELLGLLGPNGAGKTTLIRAITGRVRLDAGEIKVFDRAVDGRRTPPELGIVPQEIALYPLMTARENLEIFGRLQGIARRELNQQIDWALKSTGLADRAAEPIRQFSGGMRRRLNIACGVLHRPKIVLLDEPTVGVDPQSRDRIGIMSGLLAGKWMFLSIVGMAQLTVMFLWGRVVFGLPLFDHVPGFVVMTVITASAAAALGLVLATLARTRAQLSGFSTILILTMSALGGSMFPRFLMSDTMQQVGLLTFNAWALDGYLKVFWRNAPLWQLWPQVLVLITLTLLFLGCARLLARRWEGKRRPGLWAGRAGIEQRSPSAGPRVRSPSATTGCGGNRGVLLGDGCWVPRPAGGHQHLRDAGGGAERRCDRTWLDSGAPAGWRPRHSRGPRRDADAPPLGTLQLSA